MKIRTIKGQPIISERITVGTMFLENFAIKLGYEL